MSVPAELRGVDYSVIIDDFLVLSSSAILRKPNALRALRVSHCLNLAGNCEFAENLSVLDAHFKDATVSEVAALLEPMMRFLREARAAKKIVLVQCLAGMSRSPAVVVAYLVLECGQRVDDALELVRTRRPCVRPNKSILEFLRKREAAEQE